MFSEPLPSARRLHDGCMVVSGDLLVGVLFPDPELVHLGCAVWIHTWGECGNKTLGEVVRASEHLL